MIYNEIITHYADKEVLDLGCGNCALLEKLMQKRRKSKGH